MGIAKPARGWVIACMAGVLAVGLVVAGCGDSGDSIDASGSTSSSKPSSNPTDAQSYVGLTKQRAIDKADAAGQLWRIGREDDEQFMVTQDYVPDRVTFEIDDGKVTKATLG